MVERATLTIYRCTSELCTRMQGMLVPPEGFASGLLFEYCYSVFLSFPIIILLLFFYFLFYITLPSSHEVLIFSKKNK